MAPFYRWGSTALRLQSNHEEVVYFLPLSSQNSWYSLDQLRKDERLGWHWSHPVVLNMGPLDWESSTLTTRPSKARPMEISNTQSIDEDINLCVSEKYLRSNNSFSYGVSEFWLQYSKCFPSFTTTEYLKATELICTMSIWCTIVTFLVSRIQNVFKK